MDYSLLLGIHDVARAEQEEDDGQRVVPDDTDNECNPILGAYGASPEGIAGYLNSNKPLGPGEFDPFIDVYAIGSTAGAPTKEVYFMGLIDILTLYDAKKKAAHAAKTVKHGAAERGQEITNAVYKRHKDCESKDFETEYIIERKAGAEISTVHPDQYGKRFLEFVTNIFA